MTATIRWEFTVGQNGLPTTYSGLLTGKVQRLLKDDGITKSQWINSVWNTRYRVRTTEGAGGWERNKM